MTGKFLRNPKETSKNYEEIFRINTFFKDFSTNFV